MKQSGNSNVEGEEEKSINGNVRDITELKSFFDLKVSMYHLAAVWLMEKEVISDSFVYSDSLNKLILTFKSMMNCNANGVAEWIC